MTHAFLRPSLAIAGALLTFAVTMPVDAKKDVNLPTISVVGVDNVCDGFTVGTDTGGNTTLTCIPAGSGTPPPGGGAGAPTACLAQIGGTTAVMLPNTGGNVNLTVQGCTASSAITYNWFRNGSSGASTQASWTDTPTLNAQLGTNTTTVNKTSSYQVQACVGTACVTIPANPLTAVVPAATGGGGNPTPPPSGGGGGPTSGWNGTCPGFTNTHVITMNWAAPTRQYTFQYGGFGVNDAVVVQFTTGSTSSTNSLPRIAAAEYNSAPSSRIATLSTTPCDFGPQSILGAGGEGNSVTMVFGLGTGNGYGYYPVFPLNTTIYLNMKNSPSSSCTSSGACDMFVDLVKPGGL